MPKGQPPSAKMDARRDAFDAEFRRLTGGNIRTLPVNLRDEPPVNPPALDLMNRAANKLARTRQAQMQRQNRPAADAAMSVVDQIDTARENEAMRAGRARRRMSQ